uniref:RNA polymerase subunit H/Rpb5 C-terminal domain-containing protein n=1 Tax=viral metagenome TaxID=1070528 RepID=A0A6C0ES67_9ZZZZ
MSTSQSTNLLISSVYKSRKNILELMQKQGYNVDDYNNFSVSEVNYMKQNNQLDMLLEKIQENPVTKRKNKIYIRYHLSKPIRTNIHLQEMIDDLFNLEQILTKDDTLFIIIKDEVNETLTNELKHIWEKDGIFIVIESIKRLQFNILNHHLVPEHRIMSDQEVAEIMQKYNITDKIQFPDISRFDPVARVIGLRPGQVCHIIRPSKTAITANYYRVCV